MGLEIFQVDAFTNRPFQGNPAAVCVLPGGHAGAQDASWMQSLAREMNLSETAYLYRVADGFSLRWFTPAVEVDLCGHATLASAHILWEKGYLDPGAQARFQTRSGLLTAKRGDGWIDLDFPALSLERAEAPPELIAALGVVAIAAGKSRFDYLVETDSEASVRSARPDHSALRKLPVRGIILTSRASTPGFDFVSRFFAPGSGIDEDPVTGSAHCCLGPYWSSRLGKQEFTAYQASARGGVVRVRLEGNRVKLGGQAVTVLRGELAQNASAPL